MKYKIKKIISKLIPKSITQILLIEKNKFLNNSYSQEGEDLILDKFLSYKKNGFYIDIGAHHPMRFSNTYLFYKRGWRGINIDALPGSMVEFKKHRKLDINLEIGINDTGSQSTFYIFNESAINTFNKKEAELKDGKNGNFILDKISIKTLTLAKVLDQYLPEIINEIDFLSIDVEGNEYLVLKSNDWGKYKPNYILVEELKISLSNIQEDSLVYKLLIEKGYLLISKTYNTCFYKLNNE